MFSTTLEGASAWELPEADTMNWGSITLKKAFYTFWTLISNMSFFSHKTQAIELYL